MLRWVRAAALAALILAAPLASAIAGGVPSLPSTPPYNDPSQIVATLNAIINQLNGQQLGTGGYAPGANIGLGPYCTVNNVVPGTPVTCNGQRGTITSGTLTTAALTNQTLTVNDSSITAASACTASLTNYSGTFATAGIPISYLPVVFAGQIQFLIANIHSTNALNGNITLVFNCSN